MDLIEDGEKKQDRKEDKDEENDDKKVGDELQNEEEEEICIRVIKDGEDFSVVKFYRNYNRRTETWCY